MKAGTVIGRTFGVIAILLLIVLIVLRLYLGSWLLSYVNQTLNTIQGYKGSVQSIDLDLYRGAYKINGLKLNKVDGDIPTPFIAIGRTDLSIQWAALLHGKVVSKIVLTKPAINFAVKGDAKQTGENVDWTRPIRNLMPIDINYVRIEDGSVTYQDFASTPHVDIYVHHMDGEINNLRNADKAGDALPSTVAVKGSTIGNGRLKLDGHMNILKQSPDMDLLLALDAIDLPAINSYTEAYGAFDFKSGTLNVYTHLVTRDGAVSGYVKPIVTHLSVDVLKNAANPAEVAWSSVVAAVLQIFSNPAHDQFATKVDLEGNLGHVGTDTWSALINILRNAYIGAFNKGFEQSGQSDTVGPQK